MRGQRGTLLPTTVPIGSGIRRIQVAGPGPARKPGGCLSAAATTADASRLGAASTSAAVESASTGVLAMLLRRALVSGMASGAVEGMTERAPTPLCP
ncbi:hypothetical protein ADK86_35115 [Streptomyces sp. NRRL F-5755]|nr:hypothetical protein ADK86_35115 [Streptomyces sp. NRRL F-5755]